MDTKPKLADDLLVGAAAISEYVFGTPDDRRKIYSLVGSGELPVFRLGATRSPSSMPEWAREIISERPYSFSAARSPRGQFSDTWAGGRSGANGSISTAMARLDRLGRLVWQEIKYMLVSPAILCYTMLYYAILCYTMLY